MAEAGDSYPTDDDIFAILGYYIPIQALVEVHPFDEYILTMDGGESLGQEYLRISDTVVFALFYGHIGQYNLFDIECRFLIYLVNFAIGRRAYNTSFPCEGDVFGFVCIDECT